MPGMKLDFLKNPSQRVATGKSLPLKQVEAIVLYGRPEQRAKVIQKLLPSTYGLSLNKSTHHILLSVLDHCDGMTRVQMLYNVRRKILDLCTSPVGNVVLQHMIEKLPPRQRKEIAEVFVLNVEQEEFKRLCEHPFGNHVAQKLMEYQECADVLEANFTPFLSQLACHEYGMRVVAKYIDVVESGWQKAILALFPGVTLDEEDYSLTETTPDALDSAVARHFASQKESMVVAALLRHVQVPSEVKDAMCAHLCEYAIDYLDPEHAPQRTSAAATTAAAAAKKTTSEEEEDPYALPDFGNASSKTPKPRGGEEDSGETPFSPRHVHAFVAVFEHGDAAQRSELWQSLEAVTQASGAAGRAPTIVKEKATVAVSIAAVRFHEPSRAALYAQLFAPSTDGKALTIAEVAADPVRTMLLRAYIDVDVDRITKAQRAELAKSATVLSQSPVASPVLQKLVEADASGNVAAAVFRSIRGDIPQLINHSAASFLLQALLPAAHDAVRADLVQELLSAMSDLHQTLSYAQGSRVMQKVLAYAPDETIVKTVDELIANAARADNAEEEKDDDDDNDDKEEEAAAGSGGESSEDDEAEKPLSRKEQREINKTRHYDIRSDALVAYALHNHACYVIQALLRETRSRQLDRERRLLMNELKPHVFDLAVSPWAGRVVLETMMQVGSAQLTEAMKNVVFLRAESWLSDVSEDRKKRGAGVDPTVRNMLKRQREYLREGKEIPSDEKGANDDGAGGGKKKKQKKLHRSLKK